MTEEDYCGFTPLGYSHINPMAVSISTASLSKGLPRDQ
jgi:hypothetical protein